MRHIQETAAAHPPKRARIESPVSGAAPEPELSHGPISGEVGASTATIWGRATAQATGMLRLRCDGAYVLAARNALQSWLMLARTCHFFDNAGLQVLSRATTRCLIESLIPRPRAPPAPHPPRPPHPNPPHAAVAPVLPVTVAVR